MTSQSSLKPAAPLFAALDLGTNNCRLLIAAPSADGFRVVESFSRIVRLGDGLSRTGVLDQRAMERALAALQICADKMARRGVSSVRAVATQACRAAQNGEAFIARVKAATGLEFSIITPREEARLSVAGCLNLLDRSQEAALVIDVGGGSTELSWVDLRPDRNGRAKPAPPVGAWLSIPIGVVTLAERYPEEHGGAAWFEAMRTEVRLELQAFKGADMFRDAFARGKAHLIGTSGAITSLAGMHLGLVRYDRNRVDGLWMTRDACRNAADQLMMLGPEGRAGQPCIGPDRADLVLAGAAILEAVQDVWPCDRVRVADRGLREGILLSLIAEHAGANPKRRRRRHKRRSLAAPAASALAGA
jgi:exopolyphosphatase/guanosine-5'-triphosphate,3'-diphosphate pyrophosphatase